MPQPEVRSASWVEALRPHAPTHISNRGRARARRSHEKQLLSPAEAYYLLAEYDTNQDGKWSVEECARAPSRALALRRPPCAGRVVASSLVVLACCVPHIIII